MKNHFHYHDDFVDAMFWSDKLNQEELGGKWHRSSLPETLIDVGLAHGLSPSMFLSALDFTTQTVEYVLKDEGGYAIVDVHGMAGPLSGSEAVREGREKRGLDSGFIELTPPQRAEVEALMKGKDGQIAATLTVEEILKDRYVPLQWPSACIYRVNDLKEIPPSKFYPLSEITGNGLALARAGCRLTLELYAKVLEKLGYSAIGNFHSFAETDFEKGAGRLLYLGHPSGFMPVTLYQKGHFEMSPGPGAASSSR